MQWIKDNWVMIVMAIVGQGYVAMRDNPTMSGLFFGLLAGSLVSGLPIYFARRKNLHHREGWYLVTGMLTGAIGGLLFSVPILGIMTILLLLKREPVQQSKPFVKAVLQKENYE